MAASACRASHRIVSVCMRLHVGSTDGKSRCAKHCHLAVELPYSRMVELGGEHEEGQIGRAGGPGEAAVEPGLHGEYNFNKL